MSTNLETVLDKIQADKNKNCKPENIRYGTELLGVKGTLKPVTLNGGDTATCIYLQDETPADKNGIWIHTDKTYENIYVENEKYTNEYSYMFGQDNDNADESNLVQKIKIPQSFYGSTYCQSGNVIHMFGYQYSTNTNDVSKMSVHYKYDYDTNEWTKLSDCPTPQGEGGAVWIGDYIYIFGTAHPEYRKYAYKYNTLNDSWERLADITTSSTNTSYNGFIRTSACNTTCCYNPDTPNYIYIACFKYIVEYNISENTYTDLDSINSQYQKYNSNYWNATITDAHVARLFDFYEGKLIFAPYRDSYSPYTLKLALVALSTGATSYITYRNYGNNEVPAYMSLFNGVFFAYSTNSASYCVTLNLSTKTSATMPSTAYDKLALVGAYPRMVVSTGDEDIVVMFYVKDITARASGIKLQDKSYEFDDNTLVIYAPADGATGMYKTNLFKSDKLLNSGKLITFIDDVNIYDATEKKLIKNLSTYYGNGTDWIKIK